MKSLQRSSAAMLIVVACGAMLLTNSAHAEDEPLPPEVKRLIGMKVLLRENPAFVPVDWEELLGAGIGVENLGFEVLQKNETVVLTVTRIQDSTKSILDARVISGKLLRVYLEDGKRKWRKNEMQWYRITNQCSRNGMNKPETILGMWKFEPNRKCTDSSSLVKKAWLVNLENGHLTEISTQGVSCREPDCGDE